MAIIFASVSFNIVGYPVNELRNFSVCGGTDPTFRKTKRNDSVLKHLIDV